MVILVVCNTTMKLSQTLLLINLLYLASCDSAITNNNNKVVDDNDKEISFYTEDSVKILGDLFEYQKAAPCILLFHQGGSNARGEYHEIINHLVADGFNVLAIDQRLGGQTYGSYNRTIAAMPLNEFTYCDAYLDMEGALAFMTKNGFTGPKILWGSSYSASLAIKLADTHQQDVAAVLAFSPASGGPMQPCKPDDYFASLKLPLLLLRPKNEMEIESVAKQFQLAADHNHEVYIAENGTHGSSMLIENRVKANVKGNWERVNAFLQKSLP